MMGYGCACPACACADCAEGEECEPCECPPCDCDEEVAAEGYCVPGGWDEVFGSADSTGGSGDGAEPPQSAAEMLANELYGDDGAAGDGEMHLKAAEDGTPADGAEETPDGSSVGCAAGNGPSALPALLLAVLAILSLSLPRRVRP
jgi:uncharacterized protein (TIGR03382 family)